MIFRRDDNGFNQFSLWGLITTPFRRISRRINELIEGDGGIQHQSLGSRLSALVLLPFRLFGATLAFFAQTWSSSRSLKAFVLGVPVLVVAAIFIVGTFLVDFLITESGMIDSNTAYLNFQRGRPGATPEDALCFAEKLVEIKPDSDEFRYELGVCQFECGNEVKALDIMRSIAPAEGAGFSLAHTWLALYYARNKQMENTSPEDLGQVEHHLRMAVEADAENQVAQTNLANYYIKLGDAAVEGSLEWRNYVEKAIEHYQVVLDGPLTLNKLSVIPKVADLKLKLGESKDAIARQMSAQIIQLQVYARNNPDAIPIWMCMIKCAIIKEDYKQAIQIVQNGFETARDPESKRMIRRLASEVYVSNASRFPDFTNRAQFDARVRTLVEAVSANPNDINVSRLLLDYVRVPDESQQDPVVDEKWLRESKIRVRTAGVVNILIGMREISAGNFQAGSKLWRIAEKDFVGTPILVNNLMYVAVANRPQTIPNLLDMITLAIEQFPKQKELYLTRGLWLLKNDRAKQAVADLKVAEEAFPDLPTTHSALIECYEILGEESLVVEQKKKYEKLLRVLDEGRRTQVEKSIEEVKKRETKEDKPADVQAE